MGGRKRSDVRDGRVAAFFSVLAERRKSEKVGGETKVEERRNLKIEWNKHKQGKHGGGGGIKRISRREGSGLMSRAGSS